MIPLSQSSALSYLTCPRKCYYEHALRRRLPATDARLDGTVWHAAQDAYYSGLSGRINRQACVGRAIKSIDSAALSSYRSIELTALMIGYGARYAADSLTVIEVEREFRITIANEEWRGRIDLITQDRRGDYWVWEHKTTESDTSLGSHYWQRLDINYQDPLYVLGAGSLGYRIEGVVYNVVSRRVIRPVEATPEDKRKYTAKGKLYANQRAESETPDAFLQRLAVDIGSRPSRYYTRHVVRRNAIEHAAAQRDLISVGRLIRASESSDSWPRNPASCHRFGRACDYLPVCNGQAEIEDYPIKEQSDGKA